MTGRNKLFVISVGQKKSPCAYAEESEIHFVCLNLDLGQIIMSVVSIVLMSQ